MQRRGQKGLNQEEILASMDGFSLEPSGGTSLSIGRFRWRPRGGLETHRARILRTGRVDSQQDGRSRSMGSADLKDVAALYAIFESSRVGPGATNERGGEL